MKGIYTITNTTTGKVYIGSSKMLSFRLKKHRRNLRLGRHPNKYLQSSYDKHGMSSFKFEIVCYCDDYKELEQHLIDTIPWEDTYNIAKSVLSPQGTGDKPCHLIDLTGKVVKSYDSIVELLKDFGITYRSVATVNTHYVFRMKYRIVTKEFYSHSRDVVLSWEDKTKDFTQPIVMPDYGLTY